MELTVVRLKSDPAEDETRFGAVLSDALEGLEYRTVSRLTAGTDYRGRRLLFAVPLGRFGENAALRHLLGQLRSEAVRLDGAVSAIFVDAESELYTKEAATELAFALNAAGSALVGRPLVEGTRSLANFKVQARTLGTDLEGAYRASLRDLAERLCEDSFPRREKPVLLALHASNYMTSNTMQLWGRVKERLGEEIAVEEIGLRNGTIFDCAGCPYTACRHFGEAGRCFYGGL
ncbi:MAG: NADPH-dependent oxidoreductase, partial [Firmicutes bacterium]|nr:NADPH-dependent oxidoreductase [Bacillota bacterium]